ncbi:SGNH/GDSL hydrolase family protein [Arachnia propionica]|uniref:SGNH/GDSL hydrolase family protein n=1 Tax=Arachnia propionica TaxID=1750 RepID=A0A3P1T2V7_9ACTN|nr:SGNH/GDSL hydrolase family protein [Arachnia propionica]MDO5084740.1 SGNH/GDSL hydrolase family protein [Arachnia propionica]RRD03618.1 SGNH/GDSL hydrolase family protein [Arachnia propionica]
MRTRSGWLLAGAAVVGVGVALGVALRRARVEQQVTHYPDHWRQRPRSMPEDAIHHVVLGDSAAQGVGASHVDRGYVSLLADRLAEATGRDVVVTNLSVPAATTRDLVREQLPLLAELPRPADVVTVAIGRSDVVEAGNNLYSFEKHFGDIVAALPEGSFVADVPSLNSPPWAGRSCEFAEVARELVALHDHHLVPLQEATRGMRRFHPGDRGHRIWADAFWLAIEDSGTLDRLRFRDAAGLG